MLAEVKRSRGQAGVDPTQHLGHHPQRKECVGHLQHTVPCQHLVNPKQTKCRGCSLQSQIHTCCDWCGCSTLQDDPVCLVMCMFAWRTDCLSGPQHLRVLREELLLTCSSDCDCAMVLLLPWGSLDGIKFHSCAVAFYKCPELCAALLHKMEINDGSSHLQAQRHLQNDHRLRG